LAAAQKIFKTTDFLCPPRSVYPTVGNKGNGAIADSRFPSGHHEAHHSLGRWLARIKTPSQKETERKPIRPITEVREDAQVAEATDSAINAGF